MAKVTARKAQVFVTKAGDVLTEEDIEALADEAEAGYDPSELRPQRVGRPSLGSGVSPRVSFRASRKLYEAARERAAEEGRSVSELAREAMERYVASGDERLTSERAGSHRRPG